MIGVPLKDDMDPAIDGTSTCGGVGQQRSGVLPRTSTCSFVELHGGRLETRSEGVRRGSDFVVGLLRNL
jgi:hypothetical protein